MSHITFGTGTIIPASWLQDVDTVTYTYFQSANLVLPLNKVIRLSDNADNSALIGLAGVSKGLRLGVGAAGANIDGVDPTLSVSYQPLTINGSVVSLGIAGTAKLTVNADGSVTIPVSVATPLVGVTTNTAFGLLQNNIAYWQLIAGGGGASFIPTNDNSQVIGTPTNRVLTVTTSNIDSGTTGSVQMRVNNGEVVADFIRGGGVTVNHLTFQGSISGAGGVAIFPTGSDANIDMVIQPRGTGTIKLGSDIAGGNVPQLVIGGPTNAVNHWRIEGAATTNSIRMLAEGTDANISSSTTVKGSGSHLFYTDSFNAQQVTFLHTAGANRQVTLTGSNGGNPTLGTTAGNIAFAPGGTTVVQISNQGTIGINTTPAASGNGISFPSTQSASSDVNTLDDYEEGTWTPSVGGNATYTTQTGTYTKIGRMVFVRCLLSINVIGTGSTNQITGLPFTSTSGAFSLSVGDLTGAASSIVSIYANISSASTIINLRSLLAAGGSFTTNAIFQGATTIVISGSYETT